MTSIQYSDGTLRILRLQVTQHLNDAVDADGRAKQARKNLRQAATTAANCRAAAAEYQALLDHAEGKPATPVEPDPADERTARIAAFRQMLDWLEDHPDAPMPLVNVGYYARGEDRVAEVNRIAEVLGVDAGRTYPADPHHSARREFGPVSYEAIATNVYDKPAEAEDAPAESEVSK